jgi:hypothetical protein
MAITKKKQANGDEHVGEKGIQKHYFGEWKLVQPV